MLSTPFRLLDLPLLALENVVQLFDVSVMFPFSLCSKRSYHLLQNLHNKSLDLKILLDGEMTSINLLVGLEIKAEVRVRDLQKASVSAEIVKIGENFVPVELYPPWYGCFMYWKDIKVGVREVTEHLSKLLNLDVYRICITPDSLWLMSYTHNRQKTKYGVEVEPYKNDKLSDEDFRSILKNERLTLLVVGESPSKFRIEKFKTSIDYFYLKKGSWITMDNIITMDCVEYCIKGEKTFTNLEMNRFLKHWVAGGAQRLKFLKVSIRGPAMMEVFADLMENVRRSTRELYYKGTCFSFRFDRNSFILKSEDGRVASWQHVIEENEFVFTVWPDIRGNDVDFE